ncbi:hypothetical protein PORY_000048, partial [Pneumocystis oryctolagi]
KMNTLILNENCKISKKLNPHTEDFLVLKKKCMKHIEIPILAIYPATIVLGTLFKLNNGTRQSYFSHSSNIFNVIFVKSGWFWTTVVFICHLSRVEYKNIFKACLRWFLVTLWWFFITQWFFGPSIMDRIFVWTGGSCKFYNLKLNKVNKDAIYSSTKCKLAGGKWTEGYDFSGHAFLLTHASLFLWSELLLTLNFYPKCAKQFQTMVVYTLLFLWWFMFLMTSCYFHTLIEKAIGLIIGYSTWASIYFFGFKCPIKKKILGFSN